MANRIFSSSVANTRFRFCCSISSSHGGIAMAGVSGAEWTGGSGMEAHPAAPRNRSDSAPREIIFFIGRILSSFSTRLRNELAKTGEIYLFFL